MGFTFRIGIKIRNLCIVIHTRKNICVCPCGGEVMVMASKWAVVTICSDHLEWDYGGEKKFME